MSNVNVYVSTEKKSRNFLFGCVTIIVFLKWWLTGSLTFAANRFAAGSDMQSTGEWIFVTLLPFVTDAVGWLGAAVILIFTGVWTVVWKFINAVLARAVAGSGTAAIQPPAQPALDPQLIAVLKEFEARLDKVDPPPPPPKTPEEELADLRRQLAEMQAAQSAPKAKAKVAQ